MLREHLLDKFPDFQATGKQIVEELKSGSGAQTLAHVLSVFAPYVREKWQ